MLRTGITRARTVTAVAAAALLLVAGCDDGAGQSAPPEAPADQETQAAGDESAGSEDEAPADDASTGEEGADSEEDTGTAEPISGDPCADLTSEEVGAVVGNNVGDRYSDTSEGLPAGVDPDDIVVCRYSADTVEDTSASLHWIMPADEWPDDMPEEMQEEQNENLTAPLLAIGEPIEVEGAREATVEVNTTSGATFVTVRAAVGGTVLHSSLVTEEDGLDESDIPTAVELAELAISMA